MHVVTANIHLVHENRT